MVTHTGVAARLRVQSGGYIAPMRAVHSRYDRKSIEREFVIITRDFRTEELLSTTADQSDYACKAVIRRVM